MTNPDSHNTLKFLILAALAAFVLSHNKAHAEVNIPIPPLPPLTVSDIQPMGSGVPLPEFLKATLGAILRKNYFMTPAASADVTRVNGSVENVKNADLLVVIKKLLESSGFTVTEINNVLIIDKKPLNSVQSQAEFLASDFETFEPQHLPVSAFSSYFQAFPDLKFSFGAGLLTNAGSMSTISTSGSSSQAEKGSGGTFASGPQSFSQNSYTPQILLISGKKERISKFISLIKKFDKRPPQVVVSAYLISVDLNDSTSSGVDLIASVFSGLTQFASGPISSAGLVFQVTSPLQVQAQFRNLATKSNVSFLYNPSVIVQDNGSASIFSGSKSSITTGTFVTDSKAVSTTSAYAEAGLSLTVSAQIFPKSIKLNVSQQVSSFSPSSNNANPDIQNKTFSDTFTVSDDSYLVVGGVRTDTSSKIKSKSFVFFGNDSTASTKTDLVLVLHVKRVSQADEQTGDLPRNCTESPESVRKCDEAV